MLAKVSMGITNLDSNKGIGFSPFQPVKYCKLLLTLNEVPHSLLEGPQRAGQHQHETDSFQQIFQFIIFPENLDLFGCFFADGGVAFLALLFKNSNLFKNLIATNYTRKGPLSKQLNDYNRRY